MKKPYRMCAIACLVGLPMSAFAETWINGTNVNEAKVNERNVNKVYLGGGIGLSEESDFCDLFNSDRDGRCNEGDYAGKLLAGYKINPYLAFEFAYLNAEGSTYEEFETFSEGGVDYTNSVEVDTSLERYSVDVVGMLPLQGNVTLLGRAGYGINKTLFESELVLDDENRTKSEELDDDSKGASIGVGASYTWGELEVRVMYERIWKVEALEKSDGKTAESDFSVLGAEVMMHFM